MQNSAEIAVIGLGNAGLPLAAVIADCGIAVMGVDINEGRCLAITRGDNPIAEEAGLEELLKRHGGKRLVATPRFEDAAGCRTFIVIVPVFVDASYNPDYERTLDNVMGNWMMLVLFALAFALLSTLSLEMIDRDKR